MNPVSAPAYSYIAYIDESGDEGFVARSSRWFVLSAVILRTEKERAVVGLVDNVRSRLGKAAREALHFRKLKHEHRLPYTDAIGKAHLRTVTVMIEKAAIAEPEYMQRENHLYFYACRLLLERVSWFCAKVQKSTGDGSVRLVFSNRANMSYTNFCEYLVKLQGREECRIDWNGL